MKLLKVIIDTDALYALVDTNDALHSRAKTVVSKLSNFYAEVFVLPTTLAEFSSLVAKNIGLEQSKQALGDLSSAGYNIVDITSELYKQAFDVYEKQRSRGESLFDCFVMATAADITADCIFSFDSGYKRNGFTLFGDLDL